MRARRNGSSAPWARVRGQRRVGRKAEKGLDEALSMLVEGKALGADGAEAALRQVLHGADERQTAALLAMLHQKGESGPELAGLARALSREAVHLHAHNAVDIVGTGGDSAGTVNISTGSAVVAAAAGTPIAKHGNRSVSSRSGSADVLESLGVRIDLDPQSVEDCFSTLGLCFMFAPIFHPAMASVRPIRKALGIRTAFNLLGPLTNPASVKRAVLGVYSPEAMELMASAALELGFERALVVHSNGMDELSPTASATVLDASVSGTAERHIIPEDMGIQRCSLEDLQGNGPEQSASMLHDAICGHEGAVFEALAMNAGAAVFVNEQASTLREGADAAKEAMVSGRAMTLLQRWADRTQALEV